MKNGAREENMNDAKHHTDRNEILQVEVGECIVKDNFK